VKLYDVKHPYYCTEGCYYVSDTLGHRQSWDGRYDGNTCHVLYESWLDFKAGNEAPFSDETKAKRRQAGIKGPTPEEIERQEKAFGKSGFYAADDDYNLLYRWDWSEPDPSDYAEGETYDDRPTLKLFYMLQRKARPQSVHVMVTRADEPEIRAWLAKKWQHLQRLWTPFAPDIEPGVTDEERAERTLLHYGGAEPLARRSA
jgi:hypothetical protein